MRTLCAATVILTGLAGPLWPQDQPVVVELFTSQGCSACAPADALLRDLAARDGVIALALHVDYWDYIGWEDVFGSAQFTQRQKAYAHAAGQRMVYTPQFIIGGVDHVLGADALAIMDLIQAHERAPADVTLRIAADAAGFSLTAQSTRRGDMVVQLVRYIPETAVDVLRGENEGRTLQHVNVVTEWDVIARWDGAQPLSLSAETSGTQPSVVIVQGDGGHGPILAAARVQ